MRLDAVRTVVYPKGTGRDGYESVHETEGLFVGRPVYRLGRERERPLLCMRRGVFARQKAASDRHDRRGGRLHPAEGVFAHAAKGGGEQQKRLRAHSLRVRFGRIYGRGVLRGAGRGAHGQRRGDARRPRAGVVRARGQAQRAGRAAAPVHGGRPVLRPGAPAAARAGGACGRAAHRLRTWPLGRGDRGRVHAAVRGRVPDRAGRRRHICARAA